MNKLCVREGRLMNHNKIIHLLKSEVLPTTGCTEPGAVALAAAYASEALHSDAPIIHAKVTVNGGVYKNGIAVGIPGTGDTGFYMAAALGIIKKQPQKQLSVLSGVTEHEVSQARAMVRQGIVSVEVDETKPALWIQVRIETEANWTEAAIAGRHTNILYVMQNGKYLFNKEQDQNGPENDARMVLRNGKVAVADMIKAVEAIPVKEFEFMLDGVSMNLQAAEAGMAKKLGMGIGMMYSDMMTRGIIADDMVNYAKLLTASAADARMSGEPIQVMSSAGSGNHGITAILPVYAVAKKAGIPQEKVARAVAISHLITIYVKMHTGNLSALCGCAVAAATGASAAVTWLMDGRIEAIEWAMKNLIANLTGMICDGGKVGCALKLSTAAAAAIESSLLAQRGIVVPDTNGIIAATVEQTVVNLGKVSNPGMIFTDKVIMDVMRGKQNINAASAGA